MSFAALVEVESYEREPVDELFEKFAAGLAQLAREKAAEFLQLRKNQVGPFDAAEGIVLNLVAGHAVMDGLGTAIRLSPSGPLTQELYPIVVEQQALFTQAANDLFPEDSVREEHLAQLVRTLRASLHPTLRR